MRIPPLLSDILLVLRWTLIHFAVFAYCGFTAIDQSYEEGWPEYSWIARTLILPVSLLGTYSVPLVVGNSLVWGLAALLLRKISRFRSAGVFLRTAGVLFIWGGFYSFLLKGLVYLLGRNLSVVRRDETLYGHPVLQILGFPTIQISEWLEIPARLPLAFFVGMVWGALFLVVRLVEQAKPKSQNQEQT